MKLSRLHLRGFKSFAESTEFSFAEGLTGVVGPNGCGKSNIVDGIKWVLGDRSAKSLRGEEMLDVIFNGGNGTPSANFAEISLSFANNDKALPIDYDEITVTRRLYRSGESEYLLNNQSCRLKDIRELFMDTGVGMDAYSIIEQGRVDFVLKATPLERRGLFEEAAGIGKYKSRRKEAEGKLEKVQQDLLRLSDTTREIKSQIRSIKIQATRAQKYKQLAEEIRQKKISFFLHQYHQMLTQRGELTKQLEQLTQEITARRDQVRGIAEAIINLEKEIITADNNYRREHETLTDVSSEVSALATETENNRKRIQELQEEESQDKKQLGTLTQQAIATRQTLCETMHILETAKHECETLSGQILEQDNLLQEILKAEQELTQNLEAKRGEVFEGTHKKAQYQNELTAIQNELKNLSQRRDKCQKRQGEIGTESANLTQLIDQINQETSAIQGSRETLKNELLQLEAVAKSLKDDLAVLETEINQNQTEAHKKLARREILEDLENHNEGLSGGVKAVLEAVKSVTPDQPSHLNGLVIHGILADLIKVEPKYVAAIEAALGDLTQALFTRTTQDALRIIDFVKTARKEKVTTIATEAIANNFNLYPALPNLPGILGKASQMVKIDNPYGPIIEWLLGPYIVVENLDIARQVLTNNHPFRPIVTLAGETITAEGIISVGVNEPGVSLLSRKTELNTLRAELQSISEHLKVLAEQKSAKDKEMQEIEIKSQKCRQDIYVMEISLLDKRKSQEELQRRIELLKKEAEINELELTETINQINSLAERATSTAEVIKGIETHLAELQAATEQLTAQLNETGERKKSATQTLTDLKINSASVTEKKEHLANSITQLNGQIAQTEEALKTTSESINTAQAKLQELAQALTEAENKLKVLSEEKAQIQSRLDNLEQAAAQLKNNLSEQKVAESKTNQEIQSAESRLNELGLQDREFSLKIDNLAEKAKEDTSSVLPELYPAYTDDPSVNWEEISRQIQEIRDKVGTMTDVNLGAIDQLKELEERIATYHTQEEDLVKAKHSLQELIRKMNRESRERFQQVFNQIQENFNTLFRKLFGGGKAELVLCAVKHSEPAANPELTETPAEVQNPAEPATPAPADAAPAPAVISDAAPSDILEAGIEIMAKPPGKEPTSITLLSGGEKTMTALALMMAIFQLHPSPFCIMDEADATLDEANVNRFLALVREYTQRTQFIVISHNKKTMLSMDRLYGLTMQKSGVSKKVSVKMADETQPALAAATN